jgi:SsrA-binding protein
MAKNDKPKRFVPIVNKRARFEFELLEKFEAGMVLLGSEIKSIRDGKVSLLDSFCAFSNGELWIRNLHIAEYAWANRMNHETKRARKLLLKKQELRKLESKVKEKGLTIVPLRIFLSERGFAKIEIALAKGKKTHDKRATIRERDVAREMDREKMRYKR